MPGSGVANRFAATLTNVGNVVFDMARMALSTADQMSVTITTDVATTVHLKGGWPVLGDISITGGPGASAYEAGGLAITLAGPGTYTITLTP